MDKIGPLTAITGNNFVLPCTLPPMITRPEIIPLLAFAKTFIPPPEPIVQVIAPRIDCAILRDPELDGASLPFWADHFGQEMKAVSSRDWIIPELSAKKAAGGTYTIGGSDPKETKLVVLGTIAGGDDWVARIMAIQVGLHAAYGKDLKIMVVVFATGTIQLPEIRSVNLRIEVVPVDHTDRALSWERRKYVAKLVYLHETDILGE
jgi:hypothetical protein